MIFNKQGVPLNVVLTDIGLHLFERKASPPPKRHHPPKYTGAILRALRASRGVGRPPGLHRLLAKVRKLTMTVEDRDAQRRSFVYGNVALSNPLVTRAMVDEVASATATGPTYADAVRYHGSQRKAAAALGITLGKLQRGLRKAA